MYCDVTMMKLWHHYSIYRAIYVNKFLVKAIFCGALPQIGAYTDTTLCKWWNLCDTVLVFIGECGLSDVAVVNAYRLCLRAEYIILSCTYLMANHGGIKYTIYSFPNFSLSFDNWPIFVLQYNTTKHFHIIYGFITWPVHISSTTIYHTNTSKL